MDWVKRHKILTIVIVIIALGAIGAAGGDKSKTSTNTTPKSTTPAPAKQTSKKPELAKMNQAVRDGKFEFVVTGVDCTSTTVGDQYLNKTAQGKYCKVSMNVKNIGNEAQSLFSANQKLYNASKQKYSADDSATIYAAGSSSSTWYSNINPGNTVTGVIVFDIPKEQTPTVAELHDSAYSGGAKVSLE